MPATAIDVFTVGQQVLYGGVTYTITEVSRLNKLANNRVTMTLTLAVPGVDTPVVSNPNLKNSPTLAPGTPSPSHKAT